MGEGLSIAYAFLGSLFGYSDHQLPFVVDSPAGPIDLQVRPRIAESIPRLTDQFIAFTISSERDGFVDVLGDRLGEVVSYQTLFRKRLSGIGGLDGAAEVTDSSDGRLVSGRDFFFSFQVKEDKNGD